jgi:hypothetical protein
LLAVSGTFEANKDLLEAAWKTCERWSQKTGMEFAPEKNELLHFNSARTACELFLHLGTVIIQPITDVRFLGVWLNNKLSWKNHLAKVKGKMATQMLAFSKLTASAWETSVSSARQVYAVVIRSVLAYTAPSWYNIRNGLKKLSKTLTPV